MKPVMLFICATLFRLTSFAQSYDKLQSLSGAGVTTFYSEGFKSRAQQTATRLEKVMTYYQEMLGFKPVVTVLLLNKADWPLYTKFPVYGMPHYNDDATLVVAADDNDFWRSFLNVKELPEEIRLQAEKVYGLPDKTVSMQAFFDLLAIHELGHAFHMQGKLQVQRKWMGELFCNILLHTYIAEKEPEQLPALTLFPRIVVNGGVKNYRFTSLTDLEERYDEIGQQHPQNYGWYQCRWHAAAADIYDADGKVVMQRLWNTLKSKQEKMNDTDFAESLHNHVSKTVADVLRRWEADMIR